jgi:hypothetical protein
MRHLKHACVTIATCANTKIYFCNIQIKHLKHVSEINETLETYDCNMRILSFQYMQHLRFTFATHR